MNIRKRTSLIVVACCLSVIAVVVVKTMGQPAPDTNDRDGGEQWEYLAVAGPSTTNFSATGSGKVRKEPNSSFGREAYVLEQHMDKLGANGWELVAVAGPPTDPVYYFKRHRQTETSR